MGCREGAWVGRRGTGGGEGRMENGLGGLVGTGCGEWREDNPHSSNSEWRSRI